MDGCKYIAGGDWKQIEIDRRRMSAIRDLKDALDRARNDLAFEMGRAINLAKISRPRSSPMASQAPTTSSSWRNP